MQRRLHLGLAQSQYGEQPGSSPTLIQATVHRRTAPACSGGTPSTMRVCSGGMTSNCCRVNQPTNQTCFEIAGVVHIIPRDYIPAREPARRRLCISRMQKPREHTHTFFSLPTPPLSDAKGNTLSMPGRPAPCMPGPCTPSVSAGMACFCLCARVGAHRKRVRAHGGISPRIGVGRREIRDKGHLAVSTPPSPARPPPSQRRGLFCGSQSSFLRSRGGHGRHHSLRAPARARVAAVGDEHDGGVCGPEFEQQQCGRVGLAARQHHRRKEHPSPVPRSRRRAGLYHCRVTADCGTWGVPMSWHICTCPQGCACGTHVHTLRPLCRVLTRVCCALWG